jgi:hypothetical protein
VLSARTAVESTLNREVHVPTMSIQQFRATLASRSERGAAVRAYRKLGRRPAAELRMVADWPVWDGTNQPAASA